MPTLTASAPASARARTASAVATLPAMISVPKVFLIHDTVSTTPFEWPWAVSTTSTSTPAFTRAVIRSSRSAPTLTAAATSNRPVASFAAFGKFSRFSMSLTVISPSRSPEPFTSRSFSMRCCPSSAVASSIEIPTGAVTSSRVITSET